jgi:beta-galactosidase beta subunit
MSRQDVIEMINQLSESQLQKVADYIHQIVSLKIKDRKTEIDKEQTELLALLHYTIDSGRKDFAERHDYYLYGTP